MKKDVEIIRLKCGILAGCMKRGKEECRQVPADQKEGSSFVGSCPREGQIRGKRKK